MCIHGHRKCFAHVPQCQTSACEGYEDGQFDTEGGCDGHREPHRDEENVAEEHYGHVDSGRIRHKGDEQHHGTEERDRRGRNVEEDSERPDAEQEPQRGRGDVPQPPQNFQEGFQGFPFLRLVDALDRMLPDGRVCGRFRTPRSLSS